MQDVTLADGEEQRDVVIRLTPHGAIAGRILDENRDPIGRMAVFAMVYQYTATGREWSNSFHAATNDRGEYRMDDVRPGRYYLKAGSMAIVNAKALRTYAVPTIPAQRIPPRRPLLRSAPERRWMAST